MARDLDQDASERRMDSVGAPRATAPHELAEEVELADRRKPLGPTPKSASSSSACGALKRTAVSA